jgi:hypothetical protein
MCLLPLLLTALSTLQIEDFNIRPICLRAMPRVDSLSLLPSHSGHLIRTNPALPCDPGNPESQTIIQVGQTLPLCSCGREPTYAGWIRRLDCWDASHWTAMCTRLNVVEAGARGIMKQ